MINIFNEKNQKGFSLIEVIVAVFVFSIVSILISGVIVSSIRIQRRSLNIQKAEENSRFVLESMAREIRVADSIAGPDNDCSVSPSESLSFNHPVNGSIRYYLGEDEAIHKEVDGQDSILTSSKVRVTKFYFCTKGTLGDDGLQPKVTVVLSIEAGISPDTETIESQITLSQRRLSD